MARASAGLQSHEKMLVPSVHPLLWLFVLFPVTRNPADDSANLIKAASDIFQELSPIYNRYYSLCQLLHPRCNRAFGKIHTASPPERHLCGSSYHGQVLSCGYNSAGFDRARSRAQDQQEYHNISNSRCFLLSLTERWLSLDILQPFSQPTVRLSSQQHSEWLTGTSAPVTPTTVLSGYLPTPTPTDDKSPLTVAAFGVISFIVILIVVVIILVSVVSLRFKCNRSKDSEDKQKPGTSVVSESCSAGMSQKENSITLISMKNINTNNSRSYPPSEKPKQVADAPRFVPFAGAMKPKNQSLKLTCNQQ
ncbi:Ecscr [Columba guinea]|nr:Ecscr [Columba guinea]